MGRNPITVAIDGPTGAGKSTAARRLAAALGYRHVDTGAMYRAVALMAARRGLSLKAPAALGRLARQIPFDFREQGGQWRIICDGEDVSDAIRTPEVSLRASAISALAPVRTALVARQRALGAGGGVVMEGRDIGTVVFPQAEVKFFLEADLAVRSARKHRELQGEDPARTHAEVAERDRRDESRPLSPLRPASDAVRLNTTHLDPDAVVTRMLAIIEERLGRDSAGPVAPQRRPATRSHRAGRPARLGPGRPGRGARRGRVPGTRKRR
ncbi:MAG: (d)CMP kinase [Deltaproteobacteria bacterium]|nr:(d)CMP kinase [Deltaproteobacteria bacterium]